MKRYFDRNSEAHVLDLVQFFPVVAIVGPRQIGKTSLAKHLAEKLDRPSIYLDLELPDERALLRDPVLFLEQYRDKTVILDEVQREPSLFPILRGLVDKDRKAGRFILLGSASPELIRDTSESLAGRVAYFELPPFLLSEAVTVPDFRQHWLRGGFPESLFADDDRRSDQWRQFFIQTYLERDLPLLGLRADPALIGRLWSMLAHNHGQLLNMEALSQSLSISAPTVRRYLDFLESAYLIRILRPFMANLSKRLVKTPKVYIRDSGVLHSLLRLADFDALQRNQILGASWEGYVLQEIAGQMHPRDELFFYRTADGTEADIVVARAGRPEILIEIKHSSTPTLSKGFHIAKMDLGTTRNLVVYPLERTFPLADNVLAVGIKDIGKHLD